MNERDRVVDARYTSRIKNGKFTVMGKLEMGLWAADFMITGVGWLLGGGYAALFCFTVGGVLIFIIIAKAGDGNTRLGRWHRYGTATFIFLAIIMLAVFLVRHYGKPVTAAVSPTTRQQSQPSAPSPQEAPTPQTTVKPKRRGRSNGSNKAQQQQSNSGGTNTQQQSSGDQSPNVNCPSGICAGGDINGNPSVNNYGPPPPRVSWEPEDMYPANKFGTATVGVRLDRIPSPLALVVTCDRPCDTGVAIVIRTERTIDLREFRRYQGAPNTMCFLMTPLSPIEAGQEIMLEVGSTAGNVAVSVTNVQLLSEEEAMRLHRPNPFYPTSPPGSQH